MLNLAGKSFGQRLRLLREHSGKSRPVLGGLVGRSGEWVKALETERLAMPRLPMLIRLAEVLGVGLSDLTGEQRLARVAYTKNSHQSLEEMRNALTRVIPAVPRQGQPPSPDELAARVARTWRLWHGSDHERDAIFPLLPDLLAEGHAAVRTLEGRPRRAAAAALAQTYHLAQLYATFQPAPELVYLTSDRAMNAAQDADDPAAIAGAAWYLNHVWRDADTAAEARVELARQAASMLNPADSAEHRSLWALMQLAIALSHAKLGREGDAWHHHDQATQAAASLDGYIHPWLMSGKGMIEHYAVTILLDLQQPGRALQAAERIDPAALPSRTRQSRYLVEVARAHHRRRDQAAAVHLLRKARQQSADTFQFSLFARGIVAEMQTRPSAAVADDVRDLAGSLSLAV